MSTIEQIEKDIKSRVEIAVGMSGYDIEKLFKQVLSDEYYGKYKPVEYVRKNQIQNAIKKSPVSSSGNGSSIDVYYDAGAMSHDRPTAIGKSGKAHKVEYSEPEILTAVMSGYHMVGASGRGAKTDNTWFETLAEFDAKKDQIINKNLKAAGL